MGGLAPCLGIEEYPFCVGVCKGFWSICCVFWGLVMYILKRLKHGQARYSSVSLVIIRQQAWDKHLIIQRQIQV